MRGVGGRFVEIVERARYRLGVVVDRGEPAIAVDADAKRLPGRRAVADRTVHMFTAQHELDRLADQPRRQDAKDLRSGNQSLGAEAAAEVRAADMDLVRRDAEQPRDPSLRHGETLARRVNRQAVAIPY